MPDASPVLGVSPEQHEKALRLLEDAYKTIRAFAGEPIEGAGAAVEQAMRDETPKPEWPGLALGATAVEVNLWRTDDGRITLLSPGYDPGPRAKGLGAVVLRLEA